MVTITKEMYYEEIAKAVFKDLKEKLLNKQPNHCMRVDYLPTTVMKHACKKINADADLLAKQVEAYVLTQQTQENYEIESGRLIELRNRLDFGVLVVFIPQGFTGAAEDSYDIHTFEAYDLAGVFVRHKRALIESFTSEEQAILIPIFESSAVNKQSIENQIRYLLSLKNDECTWATVGGYLHYVNLIPDLKLNQEDVQARLFRNRECVDQLSNPDQTVFLVIDALVNKGLDPNNNQIKSHLINFFLQRNPLNIGEWTTTILAEEEWLKKISFDKWQFKDLAGEQVEIYIEPFRDKDGKPLVYTKLQLEGDNLVATTNNKMRVKWQTSPRKAAVVARFILILERDEESDSSTELHRKTAKGTSEQAVFPFKDVDLEKGEEWLVHIRVIAQDQNKAKIAEDTSEPFYLRGEESESGVGESKRHIKIRNIAEATLQSTYKYRREVEIVNKNWETGRKLLYRIKTSPRETYQISLNDLLYDLELKTLQDPYCCGVWDVNIFNRGFIEEGDF
jgi:DNA phosphorothioation-dependent restriction protein DptH